MIACTNAKTEPRLRSWLENVYPLYLHELSEFGAEYRLNDRGRFEPDYLPYWLREEPAQPLVLTDEGSPFGFAFVGSTPFPFKSDAVDHRLAEFFVIRQLRASGRAESAAHRVFGSRPGLWELTALHANARAVHFWHRVVHRFTAGVFRESEEGGESRLEFVSPAVGS